MHSNWTIHVTMLPFTSESRTIIPWNQPNSIFRSNEGGKGQYKHFCHDVVGQLCWESSFLTGRGWSVVLRVLIFDRTGLISCVESTPGTSGSGLHLEIYFLCCIVFHSKGHLASCVVHCIFEKVIEITNVIKQIFFQLTIMLNNSCLCTVMSLLSQGKGLIYFHPELHSFLAEKLYWWQESRTIPSVFSFQPQILSMGLKSGL